MKKKRRCGITAKAITALASKGLSQRTIARSLDKVIRDDLNEGGMYREAWEDGNAKACDDIDQRFYKMAKSGKYWAATNKWVTYYSGIIEPKAPEVVIQQPPTIQVEHIEGKAKWVDNAN